MEYKTITLEELVEQSKRREQSRPFFVKWIDSLFGGGLFGYRNTYILLRPIKLIREICNRIEWAWQRVFRGWDDRVIWSIDYYLAERLVEWLEVLKIKKHGVAFDFFTEKELSNPYDLSDNAVENATKRQNCEYDKIIEGFLEYKKMSDLKYKIDSHEYLEGKKKFDKGMELFVKYFHTLWD